MSWWGGEAAKSQRDAQWSGWWGPTDIRDATGAGAERYQMRPLDVDLKALNLRRVSIPADGNCFFRAVTDQLVGPRGDHAKLRQDIVTFIESHRADYEPFVEDDEPFDEYCKRMRRDGTWAGNMEVQALSVLRKVNVCIHQANQPLWLIPTFPDQPEFIHLTYEGGDHYNSVRRLSDAGGDGPGGPLAIAEVTEAMARSGGAKGRATPAPAEESSSGRTAGTGDSSSARGSARGGRGHTHTQQAGPGPAAQSQRRSQAPAKAGDAPSGRDADGPPVPHRASIVQLNDLDIAYEVYGPADGPSIVFTPGWHSKKSSLKWLAYAFGKKGYRALIWDRPNCGASSVCFEAGPSPSARAGGSECDMQAGVLADLLEHLQMTPAVLFGTSNGGRLSLCFASAYPELCAGIVLNNLTAGPLAAQCLSRKYYLRFADVVDMYAKDAMAFLCKEPFFEELCEANPDNRARLLATPPAVFKERMRQWGNALQDGGNTGAYPVLGIEARRLRGVRAPALCLYTFRREADGMHTPECMQAVSALLPGADGKVVTSADRDVWIKSVIDFVEALPKPLKGSAPAKAGGGSLRARAADGSSDAAVASANRRCVPSPAAVTSALSTLQATIVAGASPRHAVLNSKSSVGAAPPIQQQSADAYCAVM